MKTRQPTRRSVVTAAAAVIAAIGATSTGRWPDDLRDRAGAEVVVGGEQRAVAEVLRAPGDLQPLLAGLGLEGLGGEAKWAR